MKLRGTRALALRAAVTAATGGLVGVSAGPASAALSDCWSGYLCAWQESNYNAVPGRVSGNNADLREYPEFANAVSIFNNGTSCGVTIWKQPDYRGYLYRYNAAAYACGYVGLRPPTARPVTGPPDAWVLLPERDYWHG